MKNIITKTISFFSILFCLFLQSQGMIDLEKYQKDAEKGDPNAMIELYFIYKNGELNANKDIDKAISWLKKAVKEQDSPQAMCILGFHYNNGIGLEKNVAKGVGLYKKAAEKGNITAKLNLANCYRRGDIYGENLKSAIDLYKEIIDEIEIGKENKLENSKKDLYCEALNCAGDCFYKEKMYKEAFEHYKKGDEQGFALATLNLGDCYAVGQGVEKDGEMAFSLYSKAAKNKLPLAMFNVALCYKNGFGIEVNKDQAIAWFVSALKTNPSDLEFNLDASDYNDFVERKTEQFFASETLEWIASLTDLKYDDDKKETLNSLIKNLISKKISDKMQRCKENQELIKSIDIEQTKLNSESLQIDSALKIIELSANQFELFSDLRKYFENNDAHLSKILGSYKIFSGYKKEVEKIKELSISLITEKLDFALFLIDNKIESLSDRDKLSALKSNLQRLEIASLKIKEKAGYLANGVYWISSWKQGTTGEVMSRIPLVAKKISPYIVKMTIGGVKNFKKQQIPLS